MADESGTRHPTLFPDRFRQSAQPGSVLLRLETTQSREGEFDGAWWSRSRDIGAELRVGLDADAWDNVPPRLVVGGRPVRIDRYPVGDDTVIITRGDRDHFMLLVVPPQASAETAHAAMARAIQAGRTGSARQILVATGLGSEPT